MRQITDYRYGPASSSNASAQGGNGEILTTKERACFVTFQDGPHFYVAPLLGAPKRNVRRPFLVSSFIGRGLCVAAKIQPSLRRGIEVRGTGGCQYLGPRRTQPSISNQRRRHLLIPVSSRIQRSVGKTRRSPCRTSQEGVAGSGSNMSRQRMR